MKYQTSFNMNIKMYSKVAKAAHRTGKTMSELIIEMMYRYAKDHKGTSIAKGTVKYQSADKKENWTIFRIALDEDDYELFTDMRKVFKCSVSFLVALAIKKYLGTILRTFFQDAINYTRLKYSAKGIRAGDLAEWVFTWILTRL